MRGGVNNLSQSDALNTLNFFKERTERYIIASGKTSSGWWRKWSDGFIEQGGFESKSGTGDVIVNFKYPFSSDKSVTVTLGTKSTTPNIGTINCVKTLSTSNMVVYNGSHVNFGFYWNACGY